MHCINGNNECVFWKSVFWGGHPSLPGPESQQQNHGDVSHPSVRWNDVNFFFFPHLPNREIWWQLQLCLNIPQHSSLRYIHCSLSGHLFGFHSRWIETDREREREKKHVFLIHPQMSGVLPPFSTQSVCLPHLAGTQRAMHFENHNHLAVGFCDTLQPRWWMSHRIRKMTDVIWISYATLSGKKIPTPPLPPPSLPYISETSVICCQRGRRHWLSSFWLSF